MRGCEIGRMTAKTDDSSERKIDSERKNMLAVVTVAG